MNEERYIGKDLHIVSKEIKRKIDNQVSQYGITGGQVKILGYIKEESQRRDIFQKDIEEEFHIRRSSVTNVLKLMEKNGYIRRESSIEDARLKKIILTDKGIEMHKNVFNIIEGIDKSIRELFTKEELDIFFNIIDRISEFIEE